MENFTIGDHGQTLSKANFSPSASFSSSSSSLASSSSASSSSSSSISSLLMSETSSSSSLTYLTHSSSSPSPLAITSAAATGTLSSSPSKNSSILTSPVVSNASNWSSSTPYNFRTENATLKAEKGFPAGGIAGIVVGGFVFLVIMVIVVVCLCRICYRRSEKYRNRFKVNNRQSYEVYEVNQKSSKKSHGSDNECNNSFSNRGETLRIDEVVPNSETNNEEVTKCSESTIDRSEDPPPVPRRDTTTARDNGASQVSPQPSTVAYFSQRVSAFDPEPENESGALESFPDELPPPPPRDSVYVMDS